MKTEKYRFLIKEHFIKLLELNELDVYGDEGPEEKGLPEEPIEEPIDTVVPDEPIAEINPEEYPNLGTSIANVAGRLAPGRIGALNMEIEKIMNTGRSNINHENYVAGDKRDELEYVTSVVAQLFKSVNSDKKKNIRTFLFTAFNPYGDKHGNSSKLARMVARKAGITYDLTASKSIDADVYMGMIAQAIYEAIDYALKTYNPNQTSFGRWMYMKASGRTIDLINKKEAKTTLSGYGKISGDEPIGGAEGEGEDTFMSTLTAKEDDFTSEQKEGMKKLYAAIGVFAREKMVANPRYAGWLEFFKLFAEQGRSMEEISEITGKKVGALRVTKVRVEEFLTAFVENGTLPEFIKEKSGINVKFPNNKFSMSMRETGAPVEEPLYIFREDPSLPDGGEWVEMDKPKKYKRYIKDHLADIAFGEESSEEGEGQTVEEPVAEEERLAEIRSMISSVLLECGVFQEKAEEVEEERIVNPDSKHYVRDKENFIGSHVWGEKFNDGSYLAVSYGEQFPIYIYWEKTNKWYENADKYIYDGEEQESTEKHKHDLRPTEETHKKPEIWMNKLLKHLKKTNGIKSFEHISVEPGEKN